MLYGSLVLSLLLLTVASSVSPHEGPQASNGHPQQQNHKPSLIKCFECYEPNSTVTGVCSKSGFCEGHWCVKGPDSGGIFRGCMERLPFHEQVPKCVIVKGQDGEDSENCYCSTEFCNSVSRILLSTAMLISIFLVLL